MPTIGAAYSTIDSIGLANWSTYGQYLDLAEFNIRAAAYHVAVLAALQSMQAILRLVYSSLQTGVCEGSIRFKGSRCFADINI